MDEKLDLIITLLTHDKCLVDDMRPLGASGPLLLPGLHAVRLMTVNPQDYVQLECRSTANDEIGLRFYYNDMRSLKEIMIPVWRP